MSLPNDYYFSENPEEFRDELKRNLERISREVNGDFNEFDPIIEGGSTAGAGTYTQQVGYYYRQGAMVDLNFSIAWSAHTGTGNLKIVTPFICQKASASIFAGTVESSTAITFPAGRTYLILKPQQGTRLIQVVACGTGVTASSLTMIGAATFKGHVRFPIQLDQTG